MVDLFGDMSDEEMDDMYDLQEQRDELKEQRDELLRACEAAHEWFRFTRSYKIGKGE